MAGLVLAGDVGGTKTNLGLFEIDDGKFNRVRHEQYITRDFAKLEDACLKFTQGTAIRAVCMGVPGPIVDGRARATNVAWIMAEDTLSKAMGGVPARLINDLGVTAYGMLYLKPEEIGVLHRAERPARGNVAVIAAGTGLGEGALVYERDHYYAVASEGGHSDFAPLNDEQVDLYRFLKAEFFDHVSFERVLSGPGLHNIYRFLRKRHGDPEPQWLTKEIEGGDPAAAISEAALKNRDEICVNALTTFAEIYGAEASNLALKVLALGGVYVAGGIAPKILPFLTKGAFIRGFFSKGRLNAMLRQIDVRVSLNPGAALSGAAHCAAALL
ncbi:MAG TPA: glucokinase [Candidatus Binataceae bacterium]|nr:glucokinase [Candidatus Binataceae bacterium]